MKWKCAAIVGVLVLAFPLGVLIVSNIRGHEAKWEAQTVSVELTRQDWAAVDAAVTDAKNTLIRGGAAVDDDFLVRLERADQRIRDAVMR